jgi:hypothetical protein
LLNRRNKSISDVDVIVAALNAVSILGICVLIYTNFVKFWDGSLMTSIQIRGFGRFGSIYYGVDIVVPIVLIIFYMASQLYLNLRILTMKSQRN